MDEIGQRLDELGHAVTRDRIPRGLADVHRRAARRRRKARVGTALGTVAVLLVAGVGYDALRDRDPATVTSPMPSAEPTPEPTPSPIDSPSASASPSPTPGRVTETTYPKPLPGELPRVTVREAEVESTWQRQDEGMQFSTPVDIATFGRGVRPEQVTATSVVADFGSLWVAATGGVVRVDPTTLQPNVFIPTGTVRAMASSGYASIYAAVEVENGGLGVASWDHAGTAMTLATIDPTPGAAETVRDAIGFGESFYVTRTYADRPAELLNISAANGTFEVVTRMGGPGTTLVVDRVPDDGSKDIWVGSSDGELRHIHNDGTASDFRIDGPVLDVDATLGDVIWLALAREDGPSRPVRIDARTGRVTADVKTVFAREIAVETGNEHFDGWVWTSSGDLGQEGVDLSVLALKSGGPITTWRAHVKGVTDLVVIPGDKAYAVSVEEAGLLRLEAHFND